MKIEQKCPNCFALLTIPVDFTGSTIRCGGCKLLIPIPEIPVVGPLPVPPLDPAAKTVKKYKPFENLDDSTPIRSRRKSTTSVGPVVLAIAGVLTLALIIFAVLRYQSAKTSDNGTAKSIQTTASRGSQSPVQATTKVASSNSTQTDSDETAIVSVFIVVLGMISLVIYFIPSLIAVLRGHQNALAIFMLNLFLGWLFIGWVLAMIWACTEVFHRDSVQRIRIVHR